MSPVSFSAKSVGNIKWVWRGTSRGGARSPPREPRGRLTQRPLREPREPASVGAILARHDGTVKRQAEQELRI